MFTTATGKIHVIFNSIDGVYYTTAESHDSYFTEPVGLPISPDNLVAAMDYSGNLHVASLLYSVDNGPSYVQYTRLMANSSAWTAPITYPTGVSSNDINRLSIAAYDADNVYLSFLQAQTLPIRTLQVLRSGNGGVTWATRTVTTGDTSGITSLAVNRNRILYIAQGFHTADTMVRYTKVYKSSDNGATWGNGGTIAGQSEPSIAFDPATNKAAVLTKTLQLPGMLQETVYVTKEK
jgi:hypothetical protein